MNFEQFKSLCDEHRLTIKRLKNGRFSAARGEGPNALSGVSFRQAGGIGRQAYFAVSPRVSRASEVTRWPGDYDTWTFNGVTYTLTAEGHVSLMDVIKANAFAAVLAALK